MAKPDKAGDQTVFTMAPSLSDHDYITIGSELVRSEPSEERSLKRVIDVVIASAMLISLAPVMALTALAVALTSSGPILFKQSRIGCNGSTFACLKFRSMRIDAEQILASLLSSQPNLQQEWRCNQKLRDDPRITSIGAFLRHSSLDELPQLINVIRGEMSLVGPRPIVASEVPRYGRHITSYFSVRPGLTGIWQVTGRNNSSYARRVAADVIYARSTSIWLDIKILALTIPAVLSGKGSC